MVPDPRAALLVDHSRCPGGDWNARVPSAGNAVALCKWLSAGRHRPRAGASVQPTAKALVLLASPAEVSRRRRDPGNQVCAARVALPDIQRLSPRHGMIEPGKLPRGEPLMLDAQRPAT